MVTIYDHLHAMIVIKGWCCLNPLNPLGGGYWDASGTLLNARAACEGCAAQEVDSPDSSSRRLTNSRCCRSGVKDCDLNTDAASWGLLHGVEHVRPLRGIC